MAAVIFTEKWTSTFLSSRKCVVGLRRMVLISLILLIHKQLQQCDFNRCNQFSKYKHFAWNWSKLIILLFCSDVKALTKFSCELLSRRTGKDFKIGWNFMLLHYIWSYNFMGSFWCQSLIILFMNCTVHTQDCSQAKKFTYVVRSLKLVTLLILMESLFSRQNLSNCTHISVFDGHLKRQALAD